MPRAIESNSPTVHLLLEEITHRVSNEFSAAIGMLSRTAARSLNNEVRVALGTVMEHLYNHARVHQALQMPAKDRLTDAAKYVRELCEAISLSKLKMRGIELIFVEHPLWLSSEQSWRLGMILFELVTNSSRHAFGLGCGVIRVELLNSGGWVQCCVTDDGSGGDKCHPGQGTRITRSLAQSLGGEISQRFGINGSVAVLSFPYSSDARSMQIESR
jgi:two-component sensor histidine kinase